MIVKNQTYANSKHFSGSYYKWNDMLLKLFYHPINYEVPSTAKNTQSKKMVAEKIVIH